MPSAADMPMLLERPHNDGVELTWPAQPSNGSGPILYLVSRRSVVGRHFSDVDMTSWRVLTKVRHCLSLPGVLGSSGYGCFEGQGAAPGIYVGGWRRGVMASVVRRMNEVTVHWARLILGWVTVFWRVYHHGV